MNNLLKYANLWVIRNTLAGTSYVCGGKRTMSTDDRAGMIPAPALQPRLVITGQGPGVISNDLGGDRYEVTVDREERPFILERREIQPVLPWMIVQAANITGIQFPDEDDVVRMQHLANASFVTDEEIAYWVMRTYAENEVVYSFNISSGEVAANQSLLYLERNAPLVHIDCWVNLWSIGMFNCFPLELYREAQADYDRFTDSSGGTAGHIHLSVLLDLAAKRLIVVQIATCMRVVFSHCYDNPALPTTE